MPFLYSLAVSVAKAMTPLIAKSEKTKAFVAGRRALWTQLKGISQNKKVVWMHCASLGEYEQGLPVLTALKNNHPEHFYLVTFFFAIRLSGAKKSRCCRLGHLPALGYQSGC